MFDENRFMVSLNRIPTEDEEIVPGNAERPKPRAVETCRIDHLKYGFERQTVYIWRGPFKGKLGTVIRTSGWLVRLSVETAIQGKSILDVPADCLVALVKLFRFVFFTNFIAENVRASLR